ncbi:hypothetical protein VIBNISOn1_90017 [Vibrio nigripulchritudo SOn1]|uniref:Uncharacterized protein n=1 Tax=Vibrio nigripulchritudo SOn1 TaxID=1238450 RepID=A0AAV2VYB1_9VIBR|nr:hypothetical protein [Vibrio nigripulchritudo]CCO49775.1 hypothetical protein VIBNISOn1_90017 [Vibrio nigripulchritudo SOn1]
MEIISNTDLSTEALEQSMSSLTGKLSDFSQQLTDSERETFNAIINSASNHMKTQDVGGSRENLTYIKPISAAASPSIKSQIVDLPNKI